MNDKFDAYNDLFVASMTDDPLIWEGNTTIIDELADEGVKPGAIVLSVGGGGLLCGVQRGLLKHGWEVMTVVEYFSTLIIL